MLKYLLVVVIIVSLALCVAAQDRNSCRVLSKPVVRYDLVSEGRAVTDPKTLGLRIALNSKAFTKDKLMLLIRQIREKYEDEIGITLFDDKRVAAQADVVVKHLTGQRLSPAIRGFYSYSKAGVVDLLEFSTRRGNSTNEISLDLPKPGQ